MSFIYESDNVRDNEKKKFQPDSQNNTAVNVISNDLALLLTQILNAIGEINGGGGSGGGTTMLVNIPAGETAYIDSLPPSQFSRIEYILSVKNLVSLETKGLRISVQNNDGVLTNALYSILGANLLISIDVEVYIGNATVKIINNEPDTVTVSLNRVYV